MNNIIRIRQKVIEQSKTAPRPETKGGMPNFMGSMTPEQMGQAFQQ